MKEQSVVSESSKTDLFQKALPTRLFDEDVIVLLGCHYNCISECFTHKGRLFVPSLIQPNVNFFHPDIVIFLLKDILGQSKLLYLQSLTE